MSKQPLRLSVVWSALALGLLGCAGVQVTQGSIEHPGQLLFNGHVRQEIACFKCHGGDARGSMRGPSLADTAKRSDAQLISVLDEGPSIMPSYADKLSADEKAQLVSWLRQEFGSHAPD